MHRPGHVFQLLGDHRFNAPACRIGNQPHRSGATDRLERGFQPLAEAHRISPPGLQQGGAGLRVGGDDPFGRNSAGKHDALFAFGLEVVVAHINHLHPHQLRIEWRDDDSVFGHGGRSRHNRSTRTDHGARGEWGKGIQRLARGGLPWGRQQFLGPAAAGQWSRQQKCRQKKCCQRAPHVSAARERGERETLIVPVGPGRLKASSPGSFSAFYAATGGQLAESRAVISSNRRANLVWEVWRCSPCEINRIRS